MPETRRAVLVTGAGGGIGGALCAAFRAAGYRVIATDRRFDAAPGDHRVNADLAALVGDAAARAAFRAAVLAGLAGSTLGVLVNNAAIQTLAAVEALDIAQFRRSLDVNVSAPLALVECFLPELRATRGAIVNIGSVHAVASKPGFLAYAVSKAALAGLTRSLALDLAPHGVRVNEVRPGATATPMLDAGFAGDPAARGRLVEHQPMGRLATPAEVAELAVFLASADAAFITGAAFSVDGGIGIRLHDPG